MYRILVVDDAPEVCEALTRVLLVGSPMWKSMAPHIVCSLGILGTLLGGAEAVQGQWRLVPDLRFGGAEDRVAPLTALSAERPLALGADGRIYVAQPQDRVVRIFGESGELEGSIGRPGDGPGEFRSIYAVGWVGDTLFVADSQLLRVTFFDPDGVYLGDSRLAAGPGAGEHWWPTPPSALLREAGGIARPLYSMFSVAFGGLSHVPTLQITRAGEVQDTLALWHVANDEIVLGDRSNTRYMSQPFPFRPLVAVRPGGDFVVVLLQDEPAGAEGTLTIMARHANGDTLFARAYSYDPDPIPAAEGDSIRESYRARARMTSDRGPTWDALPAVRQLDRRLRIPRTRPPASDLLVGNDGRIWVRRASAAGGWWMVLSSSGVVEGRVTGPARLLAARSDIVWGWELDEWDAPNLVRYRIERSDSP